MDFSFGNYAYKHKFYDELDYINWELTLFALQDNIKPMSWNLFLAFLPLIFSLILFHQPRLILIKLLVFISFFITIILSYTQFIPLLKFIWKEKIVWLFMIVISVSCAGIIVNIKGWDLLKKILWYIGTFLFILFLPNAPYVLTDIMHLVFDIRKGYPLTTIILFLIPQYTIFIFLGMESYAISIMNFAVYLDKIGKKKYILLSEIIFNFLSALGVYLGRFPRLNSWDIFSNPELTLKELGKIFILSHTWVVIITMFLIFFFFYQLLKYFNLLLIQSYKFYKCKLA